jgi:hypothetical protein
MQANNYNLLLLHGTNNMQKIKLELTIDETNLVLQALGNMPYQQVFQIINEIQQQASQQLNQADQHPSAPHLGN